MFSLNLASVAISSALAIVPLSFQMQATNTLQTVEQQQISMKSELREIVIVAEALLDTFYKMASQDHSVFERLEGIDIAALLKQSEHLLNGLRSHFSAEADVELLDNFAKTVEKTNQLYQAIEYKKEADHILLSRVNSPASIMIKHGSNRDDIRQALLGN